MQQVAVTITHACLCTTMQLTMQHACWPQRSMRAGVLPMCGVLSMSAGVLTMCAGVLSMCAGVLPMCAGVLPMCGVLPKCGVLSMCADVLTMCAGVLPICAGVLPKCGILPMCGVLSTSCSHSIKWESKVGVSGARGRGSAVRRKLMQLATCMLHA
jgi:hypothetical protein